jgi:hypothetical protein
MGITILGFTVFALLHASTPVWVVVAGLMIMSLGMAVFGAPNSASILNSVEADAQGATAGFASLCRNFGNVIGVAFATVVVTLTMGAAGYPPSLVAIDPGADPGILAAFSAGAATAAAWLAAVAAALLALIVAWSWRARRRAATPR